MTTYKTSEQIELEYIQLQYQLADACQEYDASSSPYDQVAREHNDHIRSASPSAFTQLAKSMTERGIRAAPAQ